MKMHYRVQSVLLSHNTSALTLSPVQWMKDSETETMDDDQGGKIPAWEEGEPTDEGAEPYEPGGKMTELRIDGSSDWKPGDFLTMTVDATATDWTP